MAFTIKVNGVEHEVDVDGDIPLLWVLRDVLGLTGTKFGCGMALCGACTVHMNGTPIRSCITPIESVGDAPVTTIEAIGETPQVRNSEGVARSRSHPMRLLPVGSDHVRLGIAREQSQPSDADIDAAMSGNICRCGTYVRIREAIKQAAQTSVPPRPRGG